MRWEDLKPGMDVMCYRRTMRTTDRCRVMRVAVNRDGRTYVLLRQLTENGELFVKSFTVRILEWLSEVPTSDAPSEVKT